MRHTIVICTMLDNVTKLWFPRHHPVPIFQQTVSQTSRACRLPSPKHALKPLFQESGISGAGASTQCA